MLSEVMKHKNKAVGRTNRMGEGRNVLKPFGKVAHTVKIMGDNSKVMTK